MLHKALHENQDFHVVPVHPVLVVLEEHLQGMSQLVRRFQPTVEDHSCILNDF